MRDASAISDFVRTYLIREAASALRSERRLAGGEGDVAGGEVVGAPGGRGVIDVDVDAVGAVGKAGDGEAAGAVVVIVNGAPTEMDAVADVVVNGSISEILPALVSAV